MALDSTMREAFGMSWGRAIEIFPVDGPIREHEDTAAARTAKIASLAMVILFIYGASLN
jgi:hypothetical protein